MLQPASDVAIFGTTRMLFAPFVLLVAGFDLLRLRVSTPIADQVIVGGAASAPGFLLRRRV